MKNKRHRQASEHAELIMTALHNDQIVPHVSDFMDDRTGYMFSAGVDGEDLVMCQAVQDEVILRLVYEEIGRAAQAKEGP